jgi:hypothetical protein
VAELGIILSALNGTIKDATHVSLESSECALRTAVSFLQNPVLPDKRTCAS